MERGRKRVEDKRGFLQNSLSLSVCVGIPTPHALTPRHAVAVAIPYTREASPDLVGRERRQIAHEDLLHRTRDLSQFPRPRMLAVLITFVASSLQNAELCTALALASGPTAWRGPELAARQRLAARCPTRRPALPLHC